MAAPSARISNAMKVLFTLAAFDAAAQGKAQNGFSRAADSCKLVRMSVTGLLRIHWRREAMSCSETDIAGCHKRGFPKVP